MDLKKIGNFIATLRKEKGLTQAQLASMLNITDKAVSKWETAKSLPDAGIIKDLCDILEISVNEFFAGERIENDDMMTHAENNLITAADKLNKNEKKFRLLICTGMTMLVLSVLIDEYFRSKWLLLAGYILVLALMRFSLKEEKLLKIISVVSAAALTVSLIFTADLLVNYLYSLYHANHTDAGIGMYSIIGPLIWGDSGWSILGYLKAFIRSLWISILLLVENAAVFIARIVKDK